VSEQPTFPVWVFKRGAEVDGDCCLWYNNFGRPCLTRRQRIEAEAIVDRLRREIRVGRLKRGAGCVGWGGSGGARPFNAVDTADAAAMRPWFKRAFVIVLSCDEMADLAAISTVGAAAVKK
jgi:hypothetical protein